MSFHIVSDGRCGYRFDREGWEIGWATGNVIAFRGFETALEARDAADAAHEALRVWLAHQRRTGLIAGRRGVLRTRQDGAVTFLTLGGIAIGRIVEPSERDPFGSSGYGFELYLPPPVDSFRISVAKAIHAALERHAAARRLEAVAAAR